MTTTANMNASPSPSPSPRRLQRIRPSSIAGTGPPLGHNAGGSHRPSSVSYSSSSPFATTDYGFSDITNSLRPVQEYHNGFANVDAPPAATPPPASSPFPSLRSASRAFLSHHRQQSIPNLLPAVASIGKSLGRAISPERSSAPARPPIPVYNTANVYGHNREAEEEERSSSGSSDSDSVSVSDSSSEDDDEDDEDEDEDEQDDHIMGSYLADDRTRRGTNIYTTYTSSRSRNRDRTANANANTNADTSSPVTGGGLSSWLSRGSKPSSPSRGMQTRGTTPEPSSLTVLRDGAVGGKIRTMSLASDRSATPRSPAPTPSLGLPNATSPSRLSQFAMSMSATLSRLTQQQQSPMSPGAAAAGRRQVLEEDELYHLDIGAALFPSGQPSDRDAFSPSAFKNLETNAAGTLMRLQAAYRQRTVAMLDLAAEKGARDEELEEAETRVQNFKMQLEGMARKVAQQEKDMKALSDELMAEKQARAQERAMLMSGMSGVPMTPTVVRVDDDEDDDQTTTAISISEDLGVEAAQRQLKRQQQQKRQQRQQQNMWRKSLKSDGSYDDSDEGDEESTPDDESSVFSRSRSPTIAAASINYDSVDATSSTSAAAAVVAHPRVAALGSSSSSLRGAKQQGLSSSSSSQPLNTFQKLVKNVTAAMKEEDPEARGPSSCRNCRGQDVSFAWNTVSVLRDENKHLKQRVGQLEVAVEGALDAVHGINIGY